MNMSLAAIRRTVKVGNRYLVTNYYLTLLTSTYYGTTERTVVKTNDSAFYMKSKAGVCRVAWPKMAQVSIDDDGVVYLYGSGAKQKDDELFLTLTRIK